MKHEIYIIVAVDNNFGIGKNNTIPWHFSNEMKFFKETTLAVTDQSKTNMVIMGRNTWESLPEKFRPLPNRKNIILTRNKNYPSSGAMIAPSFEEAINSADSSIEKIFIIGGGKLYSETVDHPKLTGIYLTRIDKSFECDTFFPKIPARFNNMELLKTETVDDLFFEFNLYTIKNHNDR